MPLFLKNIAPELDIFGNRQLFNFNKEPSSGESDSALTLINWFDPIPNVNANNTFEFLTPTLKGFRFNHSLSTTGTFGNFSFEKYDRFGSAASLWGYDEVTDSLSFFKSFSLNSNKITNLANGIANNDAINLGQLNNSISALGFSGLSTNGLIVRTGANTYASRSLAGGNGISITNTNGFSGNPTISLNNSYNTSANVTVNWWNLSVSTDVLDYVISPSITYPILLQNITSGNSGTNNLRYWRTISGLGDNTGANAYWSFSYYNQPLGVDKVYMYIGIPQNSIYLSAKVDLSNNDLTTSGNINATTGTLKSNNLSSHNSTSIVIANSLAMNSNAITGLANPTNNQDAATKQYVDNLMNKSIMHGYNSSTYSTNVAVGDHIKFDGTVFTKGNNISLDTSSAYSNSNNSASIGRITLAAGKTYKLTGSINNVVSANYNAMRWYNSDTGAALGVQSGMSSPVSTTDRVPSAGFIAYITTSVATRVELRITWNALSSVNGTGDGIGPAWFTVEEL